MAQSKENKLGKQLLANALDNFYAFRDDEVESKLDQALLKFEGREDYRKQIRIWLWSFANIRAKICKEAMEVYE